tara:strand:- start:38 stop:967 length:930 start_codon:yes stop_codon:yes gene_type:complete
MLKLKYRFLLILSLLISNLIFTQSSPKLSNYEFSPLVYNPAYAGSEDGITISSIYSTQWLGFEGAPKTQFLSLHSMIHPKIGLGLNIINDQIGATNETSILANFAYKINLDRNWKLSMGIKTGFGAYLFDFLSLSIENTNEINTLTDKKVSYNFNFGTGFYVYNGKVFIGFSIPNLTISKLYDSANQEIAKSTPNFYFSSGYKVLLNDEISIWPTILLRLTKGAPVSSLINLNLNWNEKFYSSVNLDPKASIGGYFGIKVIEKFIIGYSYESSINKFNNYNNGNHSIFFKINFSNGFIGLGPHASFRNN